MTFKVPTRAAGIVVLCFSLFLLIPDTVTAQKKKELKATADSLGREISLLKEEMQQLREEILELTSPVTRISERNIELQQQILRLERMLENFGEELALLKNEVQKKPRELNEDFLPENDIDSVKWILYQYETAPYWQERLPFVLDPDSVKPRMEAYYEGGYDTYIPTLNEIKVPYLKDLQEGAIFMVTTDEDNYYFQKAKNTYKIDWEATVGYNARSLASFSAELNSDTIQSRVFTSLLSGSPYENYWKVSLFSYFNRTTITAYLQKDSEEGRLIYDIIKDGKRHQLILQLRWHIFEISRREKKEEIEIIGLLNRGWSTKK